LFFSLSMFSFLAHPKPLETPLTTDVTILLR
jgi:hypothetical protein